MKPRSVRTSNPIRAECPSDNRSGLFPGAMNIGGETPDPSATASRWTSLTAATLIQDANRPGDAHSPRGTGVSALRSRLHREGRVELRAIIAPTADQSLQIVASDPLIYLSRSVRRYRPTISGMAAVKLTRHHSGLHHAVLKFMPNSARAAPFGERPLCLHRAPILGLPPCGVSAEILENGKTSLERAGCSVFDCYRW